MYTEDDLLPISALQHLLFCERQCALIHLEGQWADNRLTVEGGHLHEKVHEPGPATRRGVRIARGLMLRSLRLGLYGRADLVEFHPVGPAGGGPCRPMPVEFKRGRAKRGNCDRVQLCAQAMCLEEMLGCDVPSGAMFYGRTRRRLDVVFDTHLRGATQDAARRLHELITAGRTPPVTQGPACRRCSLLDICVPRATGPSRSARRFLARNLRPGSSDPPSEDPEP